MPSIGTIKLRAPSQISSGDWITVKVLIIHPQKISKDGKPENVLTKMTATYNGKPVVDCELGGAISVNPMIAFRLQATKSGEIKTVFKDDKGKQFSASTHINVS